MKLSTRAKYGLKALIDLGLYSEKEAVSLQSIALQESCEELRAAGGSRISYILRVLELDLGTEGD